RVYFGVFLLDRLRSTDHLFAGLRAKGVRRLINLPSVSFFDASTARTLDMLDFSIEREIAFLLQAKRAGFSVALCARRGAAAVDPEPFDFVLTHEGPGGPMELVTRARAGSRKPVSTLRDHALGRVLISSQCPLGPSSGAEADMARGPRRAKTGPIAAWRRESRKRRSLHRCPCLDPGRRVQTLRHRKGGIGWP